MPTPDRIIAASLLLLLGACGKPEVSVPQQLGEAGNVCVADEDCNKGLSCMGHELCCRDDGCRARCESMLQKKSSRQRNHPVDRLRYQRACLRLCCRGETAADIEQKLENMQRETRASGLYHIGAMPMP